MPSRRTTRIYPYYARCAELDIPIMMQVGHNLVYSEGAPAALGGRPITLDQVAIDFPTLRLLGIHIGVPWTDEMISMCWKHDNVFLAGDAYAPKHWPKNFVHYANTYGSHKVLFGTDWPVIDPERAVAEVAAHGLRPEAHARLMRENALAESSRRFRVARPLRRAEESRRGQRRQGVPRSPCRAPITIAAGVLLSDGLHASAARWPRKPALICDGRTFTYRELVERVDRITDGDAGARPAARARTRGDRRAATASNTSS